MKRRHNKLHYDYKAAKDAKKGRNKSDLRSRLGQEEEIEKETEVLEEELEQEETLREKKNLRSQKAKHIFLRGIQLLLSVMSIYTVFLIYGLIVTEYQYDTDGNIVPRIITMEEIEGRETYGVLYRYYLQARALYEKVLRLDYKLSMDEESKLLAMEYEALLDDVTSLTVAMDGLAVDTKYGQFKGMLLEWVRTDTAVYLQNISAAILKNNEEKANEALACRNQMYSDFLILTENIAALGEAIPGADLSSLYTWSPEKFISEVLEGVRNE